jgi:hypothetical protein
MQRMGSIPERCGLEKGCCQRAVAPDLKGKRCTASSPYKIAELGWLTTVKIETMQTTSNQKTPTHTGRDASSRRGTQSLTSGTELQDS